MSLTAVASQANVARRLTEMACRMPNALAVVEPAGGTVASPRYRTFTFGQLDRDSDAIAAALVERGVGRGTRLALLVRPSFDFVSLVFALFKAGAMQILIDPGMGKRNLIACLEAARPEGFVAISPVQAVRTILARRFADSHCNVTVGRRWFWGGPTLAELRQRPWPGSQAADTAASDPAAIIFTTGSTGPPKGVLYSHGNFAAQVDQIREFYAIEPGEVDLPCFPLFALFNCALGATAVLPRMDPTRPAAVDPRRIVAAIRDWQVTQAFGSPAVWQRVGEYCRSEAIRLPSLQRVFSAGAPVPAAVLELVCRAIADNGEVHTPYGATEALPVASIEAREVLSETAAATRRGAGICVGRPFSGIEWRVVAIRDEPLASPEHHLSLPEGQIGELIVRGAVVTERYVTRVEANHWAKVDDPAGTWHRMGDVGYLDLAGRFWYCGRLAHRVETLEGPRFTIPCEAIFNEHPRVARSALVGVGPPGRQRPVIVCQPHRGAWPAGALEAARFRDELRELARGNPLTRGFNTFLFHRNFPVDIRHNAKIFREKLALWAAAQLARPRGPRP